MELQTDKIQRQVHFITTQALDLEDISGDNNSWIYNRAPDGYKFILDSVDISTTKYQSKYEGIFNIFDGHEYTHWNIYPGVESRELLGRLETTIYIVDGSINLHSWECKEYSIAIRSGSTTNGYRVVIIVWYYIEKMSLFERLMYACLHPKLLRIKKGGPSTVEVTERD